ncbi:MAG: SH3 domain-containing protein, partial [Eubacteriales bacterium]|nr:SH3 domain-containing protein [Eubacteriales bacterium]
MNQGMKKHVKIAAACFAVSGLVMTNAGVSALAAGTGLAGLDSMKIDVKTEAVETSSEETAAAEQTATVEETAVVEETEAAAPQENLVNTYAVAQLDDESYINIRSSADTESEVVGKLYNSNVATILADDGEWLYVRSGNCEGYVAKYLMTTGSDAAAVVDSVATDVVSVNVEGLMLRADSSEDSDVIGMVSAGDAVYLNEDLGGWAKVTTSDGTVGYVSADYVTYEKELPQAESREEEAARVAAEEAQYAAWLAEQERLYLEEVARQQAEWEAQNQAWIEYLQSQGTYVDPNQTTTDQTVTDGYVDDTYADDTYVDDSYV